MRSRVTRTGSGRAARGTLATVSSLLSALLLLACGDDATGVDAGGLDAAGRDGGAEDGGHPDGDAGRAGDDAGRAGGDAGEPDAGCGAPAGAACNPIPIDAFPYRDTRDTREAPERLIDAYACAPTLDERGGEIHYAFTAPAAGTVTARVTEDPGVDVDLHLLAGPSPETCIERANTELSVAVSAGGYRLVVDTYDGDAQAGPYALDVTFTEAAAEPLGTMWNTYYYLANEADHPGPADVPIYDASCRELTRVSRGFHDSVCIEGSGILRDGTVINYASTCTTSCPSASRCGSESYRVCYRELDPDVYPWGEGAGGRTLVPDRSIAVDRDFVPLGTRIYMVELDGVVPPGETEPHDGCLSADDVGGAIDGNHFDFFSGTRARWLEWERIFPTRSEFTAFASHPDCF